MRGFTHGTERQRASSTPYMGLVDRRPVVCRNLAMGFWVPLQCMYRTLTTSSAEWRRLLKLDDQQHHPSHHYCHCVQGQHRSPPTKSLTQVLSRRNSLRCRGQQSTGCCQHPVKQRQSSGGPRDFWTLPCGCDPHPSVCRPSTRRCMGVRLICAGWSSPSMSPMGGWKAGRRMPKVLRTGIKSSKRFQETTPWL